ncbi:MAG: hypothetical protein JXR53_07075 [Bacteroidales bacterium]|nr:hypothetical protein [Bacteroidales bacterium]
MKRLFQFFALILVFSVAQAQEFGYTNKLKSESLSQKQRVELTDLIVSNCLFNGDLQFLVQENDLKTLPEDYEVKANNMRELIDYNNNRLKSAKTKLDSVNIYLSLKGVYLNMLMFNEARQSLQYIYASLDNLMNDTKLDSTDKAEVYRLAGSYMMEYSQDPSSSYPYFAQAIIFDNTDTASYIFIMLLYTQYGAFDQADSIANAVEQRFPGAISPYILHTQSAASRMFVEYANTDEAMLNMCLDSIADLAYLEPLKNSASESKENLLYHMLLENMILLKYYSVIGSDEKADILDCDRKYLNNIRNTCRTHNNSKSRIPEYTTLNALAWTFALDQQYDSCLLYLNQALDNVRTLDASYASVTHNILSSIMAFTFLKGDSLGALSVLEKKLALGDTIGYMLTDMALISRMYAMTGDYVNANKYSDAVLSYNPSFFPVYRIKAYSFYLDNQKDSAFASMDIAVELAEQNFETYLMYGILHLLEGNEAVAYTYLEAAWYIDPSSTILEDLMQELYIKK